MKIRLTESQLRQLIENIIKEEDKEFYWYKKVTMLRKFSFNGFLKAIKAANILVDFDARTGHNHGTKFRLRQNSLPILYQEVTEVVSV